MTLTFRNLGIDSDQPVATWPTEAVHAALERGDIRVWRRLGREVARRPWGTTARQIEEVLSFSRPYGVSELMEAVIARARASAEESEKEAVAAEIRAAIDRSGLTQTAFAAQLGTSASRLSTYASGKVTPSAGLMVRLRQIGS